MNYPMEHCLRIGSGSGFIEDKRKINVLVEY